MIATLFYHPVQLPSSSLLWMILPLLVVVAVVYKTVRAHNVRRLALDTAYLVILMVLGLAGLGGALWLIQRYWP